MGLFSIFIFVFYCLYLSCLLRSGLRSLLGSCSFPQPDLYCFTITGSEARVFFSFILRKCYLVTPFLGGFTPFGILDLPINYRSHFDIWATIYLSNLLRSPSSSQFGLMFFIVSSSFRLPISFPIYVSCSCYSYP